MSYLPTSNTLGRLTKVHMYNIDKPLEDINISPAIAKLKAGSIVIHHSLTLHYAYSNISDNDRLAYAIVYMKDEVTYNGNRHPLIDKIYLPKSKIRRDQLPYYRGECNVNMIKELDHVMIKVQNLEESITFYSEQLRLQIIWEYDNYVGFHNGIVIHDSKNSENLTSFSK